MYICKYHMFLGPCGTGKESLVETTHRSAFGAQFSRLKEQLIGLLLKVSHHPTDPWEESQGKMRSCVLSGGSNTNCLDTTSCLEARSESSGETRRDWLVDLQIWDSTYILPVPAGYIDILIAQQVGLCRLVANELLSLGWSFCSHNSPSFGLVGYSQFSINQSANFWHLLQYWLHQRSFSHWESNFLRTFAPGRAQRNKRPRRRRRLKTKRQELSSGLL